MKKTCCFFLLLSFYITFQVSLAILVTPSMMKRYKEQEAARSNNTHPEETSEIPTIVKIDTGIALTGPVLIDYLDEELILPDKLYSDFLTMLNKDYGLFCDPATNGNLRCRAIMDMMPSIYLPFLNLTITPEELYRDGYYRVYCQSHIQNERAKEHPDLIILGSKFYEAITTVSVQSKEPLLSDEQNLLLIILAHGYLVLMITIIALIVIAGLTWLYKRWKRTKTAHDDLVYTYRRNSKSSSSVFLDKSPIPADEPL